MKEISMSLSRFFWCMFFIELGSLGGRFLSIFLLGKYLSISPHLCTQMPGCSIPLILSMIKSDYLSGMGFFLDFLTMAFTTFPFGYVSFYLLLKYFNSPYFLIYGAYLSFGDTLFSYPFYYMEDDYGGNIVLFIYYQQMFPLAFLLTVVFLFQKIHRLFQKLK